MACKECTHIKKKCAMMEETNNKERVRKQKELEDRGEDGSRRGKWRWAESEHGGSKMERVEKQSEIEDQNEERWTRLERWLQELLDKMTEIGDTYVPRLSTVQARPGPGLFFWP